MKFKKIYKIISFLNFKPPGLSSTAIFLVFLISTSIQVQALDPSRSIRHYVHDFWTTDNGLPQNYIGIIAQTDDGYLWLATQQGLARFNGMNFKTFDQWNTPEIKVIAIQALYKGHDGALWIGTRGGGLTRLKEGKFKSYTSRDGLSTDFISSLCEDSKGNLWIGTEDGGLDIMKDGEFIPVDSIDDLSISKINSISRDSKGNMWIASNKGMFRYSKERFIHYSTADGLSSNSVNIVYEDRSGDIWIGTEGGGLNRFQEGKFEHFTTRTGLCNDVVVSIYQDRAGNLWIGTRGGLARFKGGKFESFTTKDGLSNNALSFLYEDREGSLWIGTHNGLNRLKNGKVLTLSSENGLPNDFIWSVLEDSKKNIWIGTHGSGLVRMKNGKIENFSVKDGLPSGVVRPIYEDKERSIWIGTLAGLARMKNGKFITYTKKNGLSNELIRSIYEDSKETLWIGTDDGLNWFKDGKFGIFDLSEEIERVVVYSIYEDHEGYLWIATYSGLIRIKDGSYQRFSSKDGLGHDRVFSILQDSLGVMWFGTNGGGLTRLKNGRFTSFMKNDGLPDNVIYRILEDKRQNLWMSSNRGIFSLRIKELNDFAEGRIDILNPEIYGKAEGMRSIECNGGSQSAGCFTSDGKLWFPTLNGAVIIDPEQKGKNEIPPPVKIEKAIVDDQSIPVNSKAILLPGTRRFEFHYAALTFLAQEKVKFKYKLENFEDEWVDAEGRREAYYTNVPPGSYRFRVIACNNDGVWNNTGASFEFYLKPYFYQAWWFYLVCGIGIIFSGVGVYQLRITQLRRHEKELEERVEERTIELEVANRELQKEVSVRKGLEEGAKRRARQASLIYEVGQRVSSELELEALLSKIVNAVRDTFNYYNVMLLLLDEETESLSVKSIAGGYDDLFSSSFRLALGVGMTGYAALSGKTQLSGDVSKDPHYVSEADELTKSELAIPIKKGQKVIGVLDIQSDEFDAFDEADVAALETLSTQIAIAIENARLYEQAQCEIDERKIVEKQVEKRTIELKAANKKLKQEIAERTKLQQEAQRRAAQAALVNEVGQRVSGELELEALLSEIVTAVRDAFDYYNVMLQLLDEESQRLVVKSIAGGYADIFPKDQILLPLGEGMTGRAAATGETQVIGDVSQSPHYVSQAKEEAKTKSELVVPIKKGQKVIGVLDIQSDEFDAFDETDVAAMETLTTQISSAIENARLYERAERNLKQLTALRQTSLDITARLDTTVLLKAIVQRASELLKAKGGTIHLYDPIRQELTVVVDYGLKLGTVGTKLKLGEGMAGRVVQTGEPMIVDDYRTWSGRSEKYAENLFTAVIEVPLKWHGQVIGVIAVIDEAEERIFTEDDAQLLSLFADQAAIAIENAHLYEQAQCEIDERKIVEKQLEDFAYIVSHDLKAPLRAVNQLASWISEDYADSFDEEGEEKMNLLVGRVKRMGSLIDGILEYSRIGRIKGKEGKVDLNSVMKEVIEILAPPENIKVIIENELPVVFSDRVRIEQVFQNLISNAVKFMDKPKGKIRIRCEDKGSHWKISVADNGPGIDRKYHKKIFQIFQTLESRDSRENTGVGLTLVKKIVELYGGKIWVESKVGEGSTFYFTLPKEKDEL